jgi:putative sterol carrier protein
MIQIPDWVAATAIIVIFIIGVLYLLYFIKSKKLYPKVMEFQKEVNPEEKSTILATAGKGRIKKLDIKITDNTNSSIVIIVDKTAYTTLTIAKETNKPDNTKIANQKNSQIKIELNLDKEFNQDFELFVDNRSDQIVNFTGKIFYESKNP